MYILQLSKPYSTVQRYGLTAAHVSQLVNIRLGRQLQQSKDLTATVACEQALLCDLWYTCITE